MAISTLTDKGQTTMPQAIRDALKVKPRQRLTWSLGEDGTAIVRPLPSALELFGSLKSSKKYAGKAAEREAMVRAIAQHAGEPGAD